MCDLLRRVRVECLNVTLHARLLPCYMWCVASDECFCNTEHLLIRSLQGRLAFLGISNGNFIHWTSMLVRYINYSLRTGSVFQCKCPRTISTISTICTVTHARRRLYRLHANQNGYNEQWLITLPSGFGIAASSIMGLTFSSFTHRRW